MKENIQTTKLANGLTILTEKMPDVRSATVGIWLRKGSRHEPRHLNGILHFIEHAVFKGTAKRSALDIAVESDRLGGHLDAFTSHEITGFMMKVVDKKVLQALDLIADMLANPRFDEKEMRREQKVILEEIKMVEDSPEETLGEIFTEKLFPNHPLGLPIAGTRKTVKTFNQQAAHDFHREIYSPENLVVAAAGNVKHDQIVDLMKKIFGRLPKTKSQKLDGFETPVPAAPIVIRRKQNLEQAHVIIAAPWLAATDERRYAGSLLVSILGDGNSSRLWQTIREKRGLAYSVGADANDFQDCGIFSIYAGCSPEKAGEVIDLSIAELKKIKREGVSESELTLAKEQTTASILLGLEDSASRAEVLAQQEITHGKIISLEESLEKFNRVTTAEIQALAKEFFQTEKIAVGILGNLNGLKIKRERLDVS